MKNILKVVEGFFITTILLAFLVCQGLYAAEEKLPTPEEIIAKNIEAMGGKEALKKIKNKKIVKYVKHVSADIGFKYTEYKERPDKYYALRETTTETIRYGSNGKIAWTIDHRGARLFEGDELSMRLFGAKFDQPYVPYKSMKTEGIEQINGKDCYKVVKTPDNGTEKIVYYDKKSFMIVKTTINMQGNNKIENYNEEYKEIKGILFPYKVVSFINGKKLEEMTQEEIELNIEMPESIFDIPEEIKAIMNKNETEQHAQQ